MAFNTQQMMENMKERTEQKRKRKTKLKLNNKCVFISNLSAMCRERILCSQLNTDTILYYSIHITLSKCNVCAFTPLQTMISDDIRTKTYGT